MTNSNEMTLAQLIASLAARDIRLWLEQGELKFSAPSGAFDAELRAHVVARKAELISFLHGHASPQTATLARAPELLRPPLSAAEERLWFLYCYEGASPVYNVLMTVHLGTAIDMAVHRRAMQALVERHACLRMRIAEEHGTAYRVVEPAQRQCTPLVDLSGLHGAVQSAPEIAILIAREEQHLFDLVKGNLLHSFVIRVGPDQHVVLINVHHAATDAWSSGIVAREYLQCIVAIEQQRDPDLPPLPVSYADYAYWQQQQLLSGGFAGQLKFWERTLSGLPPLLNLPTDFPRRAIKSFQGRSVRRMFSDPTTQALSVLCRRHGATLFMGLLAVFKLLLSRYCNTQDIAVGTAVAGRRFAELANVVGMFTNTIVIRSNVDSSISFSSLLERVRDAALAAQANQDVPFRSVVENLVGDRSPSYTPIYQVSLALNNAAEREVLHLASLGEQFSDNDGVISTAVKDDLSLQFRRFPEGLECKLSFDVQLFKDSTALRIVDHFENLLEQILRAPQQPLSQLTLLGTAERERMLALGGRPADHNLWPADSLNALFRLQCLSRPDAIAVQQGSQQLSYRALAALVAHHATILMAHRAQPLERIGLCVDGAIDMLVGMLAIIEVGAAYVPLDRAYPAKTLDHIIGDAGVRLVLTSFRQMPWSDSAGVCSIAMELGRQSDADFDSLGNKPGLGGQQPAYVIYTSGSSGAAKGVEVSHGNVIRLVQGSNFAALSERDVFVQMSNHAFDAATFEVWGALCNGARLVDVNRNVLLDPRQFAVFLRANAITAMFITVALFNHLAEADPTALASVGTVIFGGDAGNPDAIRRVFEGGKPARLVNGYGPTENTTFSTSCEIRTLADAARCPIGQPISGSTAYVVDSAGQLAPSGLLGELLVGGDGVAHGYVGRPDLTAERFVPDPFSAQPGRRLYRTGDWVKRADDGLIEYVGRVDNQVKIRGFRVEPGEIEGVLGQHPQVHSAVVVARTDEAGDKRLVAYLVTDQGTNKVAEVREFIRERLPDYKQPGAMVCLAQMPLTPNGKIDRARLPDLVSAGRSDDAIAPRNDHERQIAAMWQELLGIEAIGVKDNFFELGGHSLLAITLSVRLREQVGVELTTRDVFEHPTLEALAACVGSKRHSVIPALPPIERASKRQKSTLSFMQRRLWFLEQMQGPSATYHMPIALRLSQQYSAVAIEAALTRIVDRHEVLRSAFVEVNGVPLQRVASTSGMHLRCVELAQSDEDQILDLMGAEISKPFDLTTAPLVRALLISLPGGHKRLLITLHHIVCDGWSLGVLTAELGALLDDPQAPLADLPVQYGDYAHWQKSWLDGAPLEQQLAYWRRRLAGAPPLLQLHCAKARPAERRDLGSTQVAQFGPELAERLKSIAVSQNSSMFMLMLAAFDLLLARHAGHGDIVVGTPIANRLRRELEPLIGFFANTVPIRTEVRDRDSFLDLLRQVREVTLEAFACQDTPFDLVVDALHLDRSLAYTPLVQVMFAQENFAATGIALPEGVTSISLRDQNRTAKFDLNLSFEERFDGLQLHCEYNTDLFDDATVVTLLQHYQLILERVAEEPDQLLEDVQLLDSDAEIQARDALNRDALGTRLGSSLAAQFREIARKQPLATALVGASESLTYAELDAASDRLARRLGEAGVGLESPVGICMQRSPRLVVAVLAVLKAGGAYVPMDDDLLRDRVETVIADSGISVIIVDRTTREQLNGLARCLVAGDIDDVRICVDPRMIDVELGPDALAYVMYTSGSTGQPKGVAVTQGAISRLVHRTNYLPFDEPMRFILSSSTSFDLATLEIWGPLLNGAAVVVIPTLPTDLAEFTRMLRRYEITTLWLTASLFDAWAQHLDLDLPDLRYLLVGGDVVSPQSCARAYAKLPKVRLINGYGPTENTTFSSCHDIPRNHPADLPVPIGRSIANSTCHVLDEDMRNVPVGLPGMLYVGGHGLARGYVGQFELTAERFVPDPFSNAPGARLYRTGDRVVLLQSGELLYLGRADRQVKIRGFRVELGEIEALLRSRSEVVDAVVIAHADAGGEKRLIAFVVPQTRNDDLSGLRLALRESVPDYLVPAVIVPLEAMPTNASGKADRRLLAARVQPTESTSEYVQPATSTEKVLADLWGVLLARPQISRNDAFFDLGGHSLLAAQACAQINSHFGIDLRVRSFYASKDLAALANTIDEALGLEQLLDDIDFDSLSEIEAESLLARMQQEA